MKVIHVAAGLDEPGAGPSYSVRRLAGALRTGGVDIELHSVLGWRGSPQDHPEPAPTRHLQDAQDWPVLGRLCLSSQLSKALTAGAAQAHVLHTHGLWLMPNIYPTRAGRAAGRPVVLSPRGMLGEAALRFSAARKTLFWHLLQGSAVRGAACLHATGEAEYAEIRRYGLSNPVAIIPNGVEIPPPAGHIPTEARTVLTLGRIHPKKGLPNLIRAWATVESRHPDWRLRIVGPDEGGHAAELRALCDSLGLGRVSVEPPLYGEAKALALVEAEIFILPTLNENFALTVAEALAAGTPVIATKGAPWRGLETNSCGWWVDVGVEPLARALLDALARPEAELSAKGAAGRRWMAAEFAWDEVAAKMAAVYRWLNGDAPAPSTVRFD